MRERKLLTDFNRDIRTYFGSELFWYKIPDIPRAHVKKPFDVMAIHKGHGYAIEFKDENGGLLAHQKDNLTRVQESGGTALVAEFFACGRVVRNVRFFLWPGIIPRLELFYEKGYNFDNFFQYLKRRD